MKKQIINTIIVAFILIGLPSIAQDDNSTIFHDSVNVAILQEFKTELNEIENKRITDSIKKVNLEVQLKGLKTSDNMRKEQLLNQLKAIKKDETVRVIDKKVIIDTLRNKAKGFPVISVTKDTLFLIYSKIGASTPKERAENITRKIKKLYDDDFLKIDSILVVKSENTFDIVYREMIIMSVSEYDAIWYGKGMLELANEFSAKISNSIVEAKNENSLQKLILRIGLILLVIAIARFIIWLIGKGYNSLLQFLNKKKDKWIKNLSFRNYTFMTTDQIMQVVLFLLKTSRWVVYGIFLYITLPIIFSIFPFTRGWAEVLFNLIWSPFKGVLISIWNYFPNLFKVLVIYFVIKSFIRFVKYIFTEIEAEKLQLNGFYPDWAMPTYNILRSILYAFMFVLIFPYLPGSGSDIFKGVSIFIGVLFSLGSSSAIANMVAGLVITYMRPFKIGDRIKIGDATGDVLEKTLLVTRIKTIKNEVITIPNSSVLSGNTINYTIEAQGQGLIIHTTVTIGYDIPWKTMHQVLIDAALRVDLILKEPSPFVLQTSLDDFYVSYQINAYTKEANKQALVYSNLHQNIQDVCFEQGIEILSSHYLAARDGNATTIPVDYRPKEYEDPSFNVSLKNK